MTDSSPLFQGNNSPVTTALTSDLMFNLKPSACRSRSYRASILPTNKNSFNPTDTCIIYVPGGRRNTYLDVGQSYMRFTVKNTDAVNSMKFDGCGASVINRIDVFHGSNLLETIQGYNQLSNYILDMQASGAQRKGLANMYGFDSSGDRQGAVISAGASQTICMPIFSGVVGVLADKSLPLGYLNDDLRLEISMESQILGMVSATGVGATWQLTDFQLELCIIELSDEGENIVRETSPPDRPLYLHGSSWRHYVSSLPVQSGSYSTLVPARFASLKQLALLPRRNTDQVANSYSLSSRINPMIASYFWRIGSSIIPSKSVTLENTGNTAGYAEGYAELLKGWHALHSVANSCQLGQEYNVADVAIANTPVAGANVVGSTSFQNGFAIAQEMESFANRTDVLLSGLNTLSSQVFFECNINTAPASACTLDFFAWYDHILVLDNGMLSVKF